MSYEDLAESVDKLVETNAELVSNILTYQSTVKVPTYAKLRTYVGSSLEVTVSHKDYFGVFDYDSTDTTSVDDGGVCIVTTQGKRFKRRFLGRVLVNWFTPPSVTVDLAQYFEAASKAASARASGLSGDVQINGGTWFVGSQLPTGANWYLQGSATITGRPVVGSDTLPIHDTTYLTGRIFDYRAGTAAQVRIGDPRPWLTGIAPITESISTLTVLNPSGRPAGLFATRTSDRSDTGSLSYAFRASVVNDDIINRKGGWSGYIETYRLGEAGNTFGLELDMINTGSLINLDPYSGLTTGLTCNLWIVNGGGSTPMASQAKDLSAAMAFLPNSKGFNRGIVFRENSITGEDKDAIALPADYKVTWFGSVGTPRSYLDYQTHRRTVANEVLTSCPTDISRKWGINNAATLINSTLYRHEYQNHNGASGVVAGFEEVIQKGTIGLGVYGRVAWNISMRNSDGSLASWSLNAIVDNTFGPDNDGISSLGRTQQRINNSYFAVAPTVTSDRRDKESISTIDDDILDAWETVNFKKYKMKLAVETKGNSARWHFGVIAQEVEKAFSDKGLDARELGLLCFDEWQNTDGTMESRYGIRYEEAYALECALLRRQQTEMGRKICELEKALKMQ